MACNSMLPHEDNILNQFRIWKEMHIRMRKPYRLLGSTKNSSYYSAPVGVQTHELPHSIASTRPGYPMPLNHSAMEAGIRIITLSCNDTRVGERVT